MNETLLKKLAKPMLVLAPVIWGSSFVVMKHSLDSFTPFYLLAFRFTAAAVLLGLTCWKSWRLMDRSYLKSGLIIGTFLFLAYAFQTFGLDRTTSGKNAFLTAVYCVIVPFLYWLIAGRRPDKWNLLAAFICIAGIGMVALTTKGSGGLTVNLGDMLTLAGGFFFAAHHRGGEQVCRGPGHLSHHGAPIRGVRRLVLGGGPGLPGALPRRAVRRRGVRHGLPGGLFLLRSPAVSEHRAEVHRPRPRRRCSSAWRLPSACCAPSWWGRRTSTPSWYSASR